MAKTNKQPWATKKVMQQIYEAHLWGGASHDFYSGDGSHNTNILHPYLTAVSDFLKSSPKPLVVCDLGCGDFNVGKHLTQYAQKYIAIDIVEDLINRNKNMYQEKNLEFHCLDIATQKLPAADCVILRQVLQHLSNDEIQQITNKLKPYKYVLLTEHTPTHNETPNIDVISGQGIRLKKNSGVNLLAAPFDLEVFDSRLLTSYTEENKKSVITTTLYQLF